MFSSITKQDLIAALEEVPDDGIIVFSSDYGDYCHTEQVHQIEGTVEERTIEKNAYSHSGWAVVHEDREPGRPDKTAQVWLLE